MSDMLPGLDETVTGCGCLIFMAMLICLVGGVILGLKIAGF